MADRYTAMGQYYTAKEKAKKMGKKKAAAAFAGIKNANVRRAMKETYGSNWETREALGAKKSYLNKKAKSTTAAVKKLGGRAGSAGVDAQNKAAKLRKRARAAGAKSAYKGGAR